MKVRLHNILMLMLRILIFLSLICPIQLKGQAMLDSLYAVLRVQNNMNMIHLYKDGFFTIGYGTDVAPFNSYGTLFTFHDFDGKLKFTKYSLDSNKLWQYRDINMVVIDSFAYTIHNGANPDELIKLNINDGGIVHRKEYYNQAGGSIPNIFPHSVHKIDTNTLLLNVTGYGQGNQWVTQLCRYSILNDTFDYYFNSYPHYDQEILSLVKSASGYILSGYIRRGDPSSSSFEQRATVVWLDSVFHEVHRFISSEDEYQGWGYDLLEEANGDLILTNCVGRQYNDGWSPYYTYTYRPSIYKLNSVGELQWQTLMGRNVYLDDAYWFSALLPSNQGDGYIAAGRQTNFTDSLFYGTSDTVNEVGENLRFEALIAKVSKEGDSIWSRPYYTADFLYSRAEFCDMIPHPDGGYLLCGTANKLPWDPINLPVSYGWILHVDEFGCAVPGCQEIVKTNDPSMPDAIRFYPNPATDEMYIYQQKNECIDYTILDMQGRQLHHHKNCQGGSTGIIDIHLYPTGQYILTKKDQVGRIRSEIWMKS